ncbi:tetratricopeptide repeat protein [Marinobacter sp. DUT-3]|uniref:tetratricopeptide repeat protein n=1 Tax=Marinobacter sp. DUT-3 TaxID=3412036 RepID=UPI003D186B65
MTTCFESCGLRRQSDSDPGLTALHPALRRRAFSIVALVTALAMETALAAPAAIETEFDDQEILITLPSEALTPDTPPDSAPALADQVQAFLLQARSQGDPRYLGYAQALFERWPESRMTDRLKILRATLNQSLHRFESAREELTDILNESNSNRQQVTQARLTLANLELVQGHYESAHSHCQQLANDFPGLIAASCLAQVEARTGHAETAYQSLHAQTRQSPASDATSQIWALGTLADIAAQLGRPEAEQHWRQVLALAPDDLYTRTQLADWLLERGENKAVIKLTDAYEQVDSLAVIRAIAMKRHKHTDAGRLSAMLEERFTEARWRGTLLHQRDLARYALEIEGDAETALTHALANWQDQREPLDTRLLLRAAESAGNDPVAADVRAWLDKHDQRDARYPEVRS